MASEYLLKKAREQQPVEPPREMTPTEKRKNWLHYNKIWLIIGTVLIWIIGSIVWNALGIGKTKPDYIFAYVGTHTLDQDLVSALEEQLAGLAADKNGDGKIVVELRQYVSPAGGDAETALSYQYAADALLLADITAGESYFFLTSDPQGVQRAYQFFANTDGTLPEEYDTSIDGKVFAWTDCPALTALAVDQAAVSDLFLARRGFYGENAENREAEAALWQTLTKGATR